MAPANPLISLCMIARDEEANLPRCLQSVKALVDEIIFVDTGSEDKTVAIAQDFGARILTQAWGDDFSAPRNLGMAEATGKWILVLDADEVLDSSDFPRILKLLADPAACYLLTQRHYSNNPSIHGFIPVAGKFPQWEQGAAGYFESALVRLFPNDPAIRYRNRIHELVEPAISELPQYRIVNPGIRIHHFGLLRSKERRNWKAKLYSDLGAKKLDDEPDHWKAHYELGVEHNCNGRHAEAVESFMKAAALKKDYLDLWVNLGYCLGELRAFAEAEKSLIRAITLNPNSAEAYCNLGVVYLRTDKLEKAAQCFARAIEIKPDYINAMCNLGDALLNQGKVMQAAEAYNQSLILVPGNAKGLAGVGVCEFMGGRLESSERSLRAALKLDPDQPRLYFWLSQLCRLTGRIDEAISCMTELERIAGGGMERYRAQLEGLRTGAQRTHATGSSS